MGFIPDELSFVSRVDQFFNPRDHCGQRTSFPGFFGEGALFLHGLGKTLFINRKILLKGNITYDINREAIGVVEFENKITRYNIAALLPQSVDLAVEHGQAVIKGFPEPLLFVVNNLGKKVCRLCEVRIGLIHSFYNFSGNLRQEKPLKTQ